jgi:trans-aconitate methyltransferase
MENKHYVEIADKYNTQLFYNDTKYINWIISKIIPIFSTSYTLSQSNIIIADIGGGTGNFTQKLADALNFTPSQKILCIDPNSNMLEQAHVYPNIKCILSDAIAFSQELEYSYDYALMKEVIHHIPKQYYNTLFSGIYKQIRHNLLIITRPQNVEYPFFPQAHNIWKNNQPPSEDIISSLNNVGFIVEVKTYSFLIKINKYVWFNMIKNRFWSIFSLCTDDEINNGIQFLTLKYANSEYLTFYDNLIFIIAKKL